MVLLRRQAKGCVIVAMASAVLPDIAGRQKWQGGFVEITRDGKLAYALLAVVVVVAVLEVAWRRSSGAAQRSASPDPSLRAK